jgi:hypothetical protein
MVFSFKGQLKKGQEGEERIHKLFPNWIRTDGMVEDFITGGGSSVEIKTESRTTKQTPNLALEWESSPGKPGAIERAVNDNIDYIVYLFADNIYYAYRPKRLLAFMQKYKDKYRHVKIRNATYYTTVILIPREDLKEFECQQYL